jgi:pimeloyl-ACP methyl ester carboxylesterase
MYKVELNGIELAVEERGSGEAIIFVPGSLSDYRSWSAQLDFFSPGYQAISYSRRYQYPNRPPADTNSSIAANAADLAALIDRLGVAPAHIVGHSYGAFTALICARDHPEMVRSLVLGEPPAIPLLVRDANNPATLLPLFFRSPRTALALMKFGIKAVQPAEQAFARGDIEGAVQCFVRGVTGRNVAIDALPPLIREQIRANGAALRREIEISEPFTCDQARAISVPTLLVRGSNSPRFFGTIVDRLMQCLPNVQQMVLRDATHFLHWDAPDEFNAGVQRFLADHTDRAGAVASGRRVGSR